MPLFWTFAGALFTLLTAYALGALLLRSRPAPPEIVLGIGAAALSVVIFLLLLFHLAQPAVFLALGVAIPAGWRWGAKPSAPDAFRIRLAAWGIFAAYAVWYLVNALAPETIADGVTYHLGLPNEYLRLGGFPDRVTFYEVIPQGMDMLYTVAFSIGRHAAAKLVEFAFFLATLPLIFRVGRRLGANDLASLVAAVFYFCAPVAGITGSSSYNDAAGVFFMLAAFYLLLQDDPRYLFPAGVLAGFCYAIKFPGAFAAAGAVLYVALKSRAYPPNPSRDREGAVPFGHASDSANVLPPDMLPPNLSPDLARAVPFAPTSDPVEMLPPNPNRAGGRAEPSSPTSDVPRSAGDPRGFFHLARARWKPVLLVCAGATLMISPWMLRALVLTGNPVAPLLNPLFPNPYFHLATDQELAASLRSLGDIRPLQVPWELAFGDHLTGTFGPLFLLLPIGLLTLRRPSGRLLWTAALLLAIPWLTNTGARFLMPAVTLAALSLGMALPRPAAWAAIALQAILCWPHVLDAWETRYSFRLHEFPLAAAVGAESEAHYCSRRLDEYNVARMIERATPPDAHILALLTVANAYLDRDVAVTWQSAEADRLLDTLRLAALYSTVPTFDWKATWPERAVRTLRFRMPTAYPGEWDIEEVQLFSGEDRLFNSPQWTLGGWPNPWEAPLAFDGNLATRWRTWEDIRAGMYLDVELGHPQRLTAATLVTHTAAFRVPLEIHGLDPEGQWHLLSNTPDPIPRPPQDIRLEAARAVKRAGFRYILLPTGLGGNAPIGNVLIGHEAEWGLERAGAAGRYYLLHVK